MSIRLLSGVALAGLLGLVGLYPGAAAALITVGTHDTPGDAWDVEVVGDLAYVAAGDAGLRVIDVSDATAPVELGAVDTRYGRGVDVVGDLAFVVDGWLGLRVIDVSDPTLPVEIGALDTPNWAVDVEIVDDLAYVADGESGLRVIDVSNPALPVEIGALDTPGVALDIAVLGDLAYVADGEAGLRVIDISDAAAPVEIGVFETPGGARAVAVAGPVAYVAESWYALRVIDVSNPAMPVEIGGLETSIQALGVEVVGSFAYVLGGGLHVIDVSDPAAPLRLGTTSGGNRIAVVGDLAYVAARTAGLRVISLAEPAFPREIGALETPTFALGLDVVDGLAYVAGYSFDNYPEVAGGWLRVIDVSDPTAPVEFGRLDTARGASHVAVTGDLAVLAGFDLHSDGYVIGGWLSLVDVSDPARPVPGGALDLPGYVSDVEVVQGVAYVAGAVLSEEYPYDGLSSGRLLLIDVSDPVAPVTLAALDTSDSPSWSGNATDVEVVGDLENLA